MIHLVLSIIDVIPFARRAHNWCTFASSVDLFVDDNEIHCRRRIKIKQSPSELIGLRSPVNPSMRSSTARDCILSDAVR